MANIDDLFSELARARDDLLAVRTELLKRILSTRNALAVAELAEFPPDMVLCPDETRAGVTVAQLRTDLAADECEEENVGKLIDHVDKKLAHYLATRSRWA